MRLAALLACLLVLAPVAAAVPAGGSVGASTVDAPTPSAPFTVDAPTPSAPFTVDEPVTSDPSATGELAATSTVDGATPAASSRTATQQSNATNGTSAPNVSRVLAFPPAATRNSSLRSVRIDAASVTSLDARLAGLRMETAAVETRIEEAAPTERASTVRREVDRLDAAAERLRAQQRQTLTGFVNGSLTDRTVVTRLVRIHAEAGALSERAARLESIAESSPAVNDSVGIDAQTTALNLQSLRGPVRAQALAAARGERAPVRVFVSTTELGVVVSTIDDGMYVREAYLGRLWGESGEAQSAVESSDEVASSYPEIWAARTELTDSVGFGSTFRLRVSHTGGELDAFVRRNERVARAVQRVPLSAFPPGPAAENTVNGIRLTVNQTYPGGPALVTARDARSGEPVDASITLSVSGTESIDAGRTGSDGRLWVLSPDGPFTVTAVTPDNAGFVEATSTEPVTVADARSARLTRPVPAR